MTRELKLATNDARELVALVLDYAAGADELEVPGLVGAMAAVLAFDERAAYDVIDAARKGARA